MEDILINVQDFIHAFKEAFTEAAELPLAFWYDGTPVAATPKLPGCMFKVIDQARRGEPVAFSADNIGCGGGRFYTGFSGRSPHIAQFVSLKEKYKQTPEMVTAYIDDLDVQLADKPYLNFLRIDKLETFDKMEGLLFFARPDVLCGLTAWAFYDNNDGGAVTTPWSAGCGSVITMAVGENRRGGQRTFIGLTDISVRPFVAPDELGFTIPRSRFLTMQHTLGQCCLFGAPAWQKVKERL